MSTNPEEITGKAGTTVQVLGMDPYSLTRFLQVHNTLETLPLGAPIIAMYGMRAKPPNFGNAGGGLEPDELVHFQENEPELFQYYSSLGTLTPAELAILGCALRESKDESGFCDLEIVLDENSKPFLLTDFYYRDTNGQGISNIKGHRVVTVWGKYNSYQQRPIREKDEVDYVTWIDFSMSMAEVFKKLRNELEQSLMYPLYPYWSHVRRSLIGFSKIDKYHSNTEERPYLIGKMIHPSWRLVFKVGERDSRFPLYGYQITPEDWYHMFDIMLDKGIENLDNDVLFTEFNGRSKKKILVYGSDGKPRLEERKRDLNLASKIALAKERQEKRLEKENKATQVVVAETTFDSSELAGSEDYTGIRSSAEVLRAEDEEYARWLEDELNVEPSLRVIKPRPVA